MRSIRFASTIGVFAALIAAPLAASADPPAVGAPTIPPVFVGAPTNDNPNAGEFTVNFDTSGYRGIGTAPEPPLTRDLKPAEPRQFHQAGFVENASATERASVDRLFVALNGQLREDARERGATAMTSQAALRTPSTSR